MAKAEFDQIDLLVETQDQIIQVPITARTAPDGEVRISFALLRDFTRNGETSRTPWFSRRHLSGLRRVLDQIELYFEAREAKEKRREAHTR